MPRSLKVLLAVHLAVGTFPAIEPLLVRAIWSARSIPDGFNVEALWRAEYLVSNLTGMLCCSLAVVRRCGYLLVPLPLAA